jgi:hypothetical protein
LVQMLHKWPEKAALESDKRVDAGSKDVLYAKQSSSEWNKIVLADSWLPLPDAEIVFLKREFEITERDSNGHSVPFEVDTARVRWERNGYDIEVSQVSSVVAIKFTPIDEKDTGRDKPSRYEYAKELCQKAFNPKGAMVQPIPDFKKKLISYTFDSAKMRELPGDKAVVSDPKSMKDEGVDEAEFTSEDGLLSFYSKKGEDRIEQLLVQPIAWEYWFRQIHWWNDGKSVGFYFFKVSGPGSWFPSFTASVNERWFERPHDRK